MKKQIIILSLIISFVFTGIAHADDRSDKDALIRTLIQVLMQQVQSLQQQLQELLISEQTKSVIVPQADQSPPFPIIKPNQQTTQVEPVQIAQTPIKFTATVVENKDLGSYAYKINANKEFTIMDLAVRECGQSSTATVYSKGFNKITELRVRYQIFTTQGEYCSLDEKEKTDYFFHNKFHQNTDYYIFGLANIKLQSEDGEIWEFNQGYK